MGLYKEIRSYQTKMSDCLISLTSDTTLSCYQACSKRLAVTLETVLNVSGAILPSGNGRGVSYLYQVIQQANGHARNGICIPHLPAQGPCRTTSGRIWKSPLPEPRSRQRRERDFHLEIHKCYSEKREKISLPCSIKPKPR